MSADTAAVDAVQWCLRAIIALAFVGMGAMHLIPGPARTMAAMIPPALRRAGVPSPRVLVAVTGLCEIAGGVGLLIEPLRLPATLALAVFLVAVFPANAYAAEHPERFGRLAVPFWPRYVGQLVLIALVLGAGIPWSV